MDENIKKAAALIFCAIGFGIFYLIIMTKLEVWAVQTNASVLQVENELAWQDYLLKRPTVITQTPEETEQTEEINQEDYIGNMTVEQKE